MPSSFGAFEPSSAVDMKLHLIFEARLALSLLAVAGMPRWLETGEIYKAVTGLNYIVKIAKTAFVVQCLRYP
jgi:hypothetical protein